MYMQLHIFASQSQRYAQHLDDLLHIDDVLHFNFRIKREFPRIVKSLCPQEERSEENVGLVLIISLISSSARKLHVSGSISFEL